MSSFLFKRFAVRNERSAMKVNTDGVLLGAALNLEGLEDSPQLLDVGTGTGTIALMLAQRLEGRCSITAIDSDPISAQEAADNFAASPWGASLEALPTALEDFKPLHKYDLIVSNPPYFDDSLKNPDAREADARHTTSLSWRELIDFAATTLRCGGRLSMILPSENEKALLRYARSREVWPESLLRIRTTEAKAPKRIIAEFRLGMRSELLSSELILMQQGRYTSRYIALVSDFYLDRYFEGRSL